MYQAELRCLLMKALDIVLRPNKINFVFRAMCLGRVGSVFSSPEHKVLRVSYCDRPLSVVRRCASSVIRRASSLNFFT